LAADYRVEHVEAHVIRRCPDTGQQADAFAEHLVGQGDIPANVDSNGLVETVG
jgi:hypothetical protein